MPTPELQKLMITAAKKGNLEAIRQLVVADRELLNARDKDGATPLHCAAWKGFPEAVELLIQLGADVNAESQNDHYGTTPLHAAAHGNQTGPIKILLANGARTDIKNMNGRTPLEETAIHNATAAAKLLSV